MHLYAKSCNMKKIKLFLLLLIILLFPVSLFAGDVTYDTYKERFMEIYEKIHSQGYFSPEGAPYHALETLVVEAPDYGHESTSETYSYYIWLEAMYGKMTGDWGPLLTAWDMIESQIIPGDLDQPVLNPSSLEVGRFSPESLTISDYPTILNQQGLVRGMDPLKDELVTEYYTNRIGDDQIAGTYGMHWIIDSDNFYGFGRRGDGISKPSYIHTAERGGSENAWQTIPHPCWKDRVYGGSTNGFGDIFLNNPYGWSSGYADEWSYSAASDADARVVQAMFWALKWAKEQYDSGDITEFVYNSVVEKAEKSAIMGDFLRYSMFDKFFAKIGYQITKDPTELDNTLLPSPNPNSASGYDSCHYLLGWSYSWGGQTNGNYPWRIGNSHVHWGYQNPVAAYALGNSSIGTPLHPETAGADNDWQISLERQIDFIRWLQSNEGPIGGGATNSWEGKYAVPPAGTATFYGLSYTESPVYVGKDPITGADSPWGNSNAWFGWQTWAIERLAELYYTLDDSDAVLRDKIEVILDKWIGWVKIRVIIDSAGVRIPGTIQWSGQPEVNWDSSTGATPLSSPYNNVNHNQSYNVIFDPGTEPYTSWSSDVGLIGSLARTFIYYAKGKEVHTGSVDSECKDLAKNMLDKLHTDYIDPVGYAETVQDSEFAKRFFDTKVYIPPEIPLGYQPNSLLTGYTPRIRRQGVLPNGVTLDSSLDMSFYDIRTQYQFDSKYSEIVDAYDNDTPVEFRLHRFFGQVDIALAMAEFAEFFGDPDGESPFTNSTEIHGIPGVIEAEDFNTGLSVITYNDSTVGENIGNLGADSWVEYDVDIINGGYYNVTYDVNSFYSSQYIQLGNESSIFCTAAVPYTGGNWQTVSSNVYLNAGEQKLRIYTIGERFGIDKITFRLNKIQTIPGFIEAESCNILSGPAVFATPTGEGLGGISDGDWIEYDLNVVSSGIYNVNYRIASAPYGSRGIIIKENDVELLNTSIPGTYGNWVTVTDSITLTEGNHTLRLYIQEGGMIIDWINFCKNDIQIVPGVIEAEDFNTALGINIYGFTADGETGIGNFQFDGNWAEYNVDVLTGGNYIVEYIVSSVYSCHTITLETSLSSTPLAVTSVPNTGPAWGTTAASYITLSEGEQTLRISGSGPRFGIDKINIRPINEINVPALIETENYSVMSGPTVCTTPTGLGLGWTSDGDWMEYDIIVPPSGTTTVEYRIASAPYGSRGIYIKDGNTTYPITPIPGTYGNWITVTDLINLSPGSHTLRFYIVEGGMVIDWINIY